MGAPIDVATNREKIKELERNDPIVHYALMLHRHHDLTYAEALEVAVLTLAEVNEVNVQKAITCAQLHGPPLARPGPQGIPTTKRERELMDHALGGGKRSRNYFAANPKGDEAKIWEGLVERGLATKGVGVGGTSSYDYYHVTDLGKNQL